jgi:hypothetical protein
MDWLSEPRQVQSEWHIRQAKRWLDYDAGRCLDNVLVYAAVELRAAIERTLLELLVLVRGAPLTPEDLQRARSMRGLDALLQQADSVYRKTIEFTTLVAEVTPGMPRVAAVDTTYLRRRWHDLSEYCHFQMKPATTFQSEGRRFQMVGFEIVRDVLDRFLEWRVHTSTGVIQRSTMPAETRAIYDRFVAGELAADQVRRMLTIAEPVLLRRLRDQRGDV